MTKRNTRKSTASAGTEPDVAAGYVSVNRLSMYCEIRGVGEPLVLLHGGYRPATEVRADGR